MAARFITFEGIDGAGKSSHLNWYAEQLQAAGLSVMLTREPGGTELAEQLRELVLNQDMTDMTELLLVFAARSDHVERIIKPALSRGDWVVSDRFVDSTLAYQGAGRGMSSDLIRSLADWVCSDCRPDRTYWFDLDPAEAQRRRESDRTADRFEAEQQLFFAKVRQGYQRLCDAEPDRIVRLDSARAIQDIRRDIAGDLALMQQA